ncbi:Carbamoyl-phosphate synthase large chain, partial [Dissostichus eleginoides]
NQNDSASKCLSNRRQTRAYAVESEGMRSLSADKCISDKRAAERLLSLRILT